MNIGDKVKLDKTKETGIITNFLRGDQVEVELDGWNSRQIFSKLELRPLLQSFDLQPSKIAKDNTSLSEGIYLAFVPQKLATGDGLILYIYNNTIWEIPFTVFSEKSGQKTGLMAGFLKQNSHQRCLHDLIVADFETWKSMRITTLFFNENSKENKPPAEYLKKFQANTFFQNKKNVPFLDKEAYFFKIDETPFEIDVKEIKEKMFESNSTTKNESSEKAASVVDLHIENLSKTYWRLSNAEIFTLQLKAFENELEKAVVVGSDDIVFIHGLGEGTLKEAIYDKLKIHKNVASYGMASEQKYGQGACLVRIK